MARFDGLYAYARQHAAERALIDAALHLNADGEHADLIRPLLEGCTSAASAGATPISERDGQRAEEGWRHHAGKYASTYKRYPADALWTDGQRQMAYFRADDRTHPRPDHLRVDQLTTRSRDDERVQMREGGMSRVLPARRAAID